MKVSTSPSLWTGQALHAAIGGIVCGSLPAAMSGISIDSRSVQEGDAFFAIRGDRFDGHDFAAAARAAGASLLVVAQDKADGLRHLNNPLVIVEDVLEALKSLGRAARARTRAKIIAITGSVGKTTSKESLYSLLSPLGKTHASPASFNNHWGVPLSLARLPQDADFAIFEIGMNHAGEIRPLVQMVRPHLAMITCVAAAHLAAFASLQDIAAAKAEIFDGIEVDGQALLNKDDAFFDFFTKRAREAGIRHIASFGAVEGADYRLVEVQLHPTHSHCRISLHGEMSEIDVHLPGRHMAQNMLAVLGAADLVGAGRAEILRQIPNVQPTRGRGVHHQLRLPDGGAFTLIDESYNANPASMRAALAVLGAMQPQRQGRRIAVLGDMLELGVQSQQVHEDLYAPLIAAGVEKVFLVGKEMRYLASKIAESRIGNSMAVTWRETVEELQPLVLAALRDGDVISIKSSNSIGSAKIVAAISQKFYCNL